MPAGPAPTTSRNTRALLVFVIGSFFILWGLGTLAYRMSIDAGPEIVQAESPAPAARTPSAANANPTRFAQLAILILMVVLLLVVLFLIGSFVIIRSGRRVKEGIEQKPSAATSSEDVWSMHRAPDEEE